ncbi:hypothetical protein GCM10020295_18790 [Streptomyces cinereospinus]
MGPGLTRPAPPAATGPTRRLSPFGTPHNTPKRTATDTGRTRRGAGRLAARLLIARHRAPSPAACLDERGRGQMKSRWMVPALAVALGVGLLTPQAMGAPQAAAPAAVPMIDNGIGVDAPLMGWSGWGFLQRDPSAAKFRAQVDALVSTGLKDAGYNYANMDDFYYKCPGSQGPDVDSYGRWVTDEALFPGSGGKDGMHVLGDYVHSKGLKYGLYVTPGISAQAVAKKTRIMGTSYTADQIALTSSAQNFNCKGMLNIDYSKPGAQEFIDSWAQMFADWGVDYLKLDGVGPSKTADVRAWSQALEKTGRRSR